VHAEGTVGYFLPHFFEKLLESVESAEQMLLTGFPNLGTEYKSWKQHTAQT
jgi:hypothetical protein